MSRSLALFLLIVTSAITTVVSSANGGDRVMRKCEFLSAALKHEAEIIVSMTENSKNGYCLFNAFLPPTFGGKTDAAMLLRTYTEVRSGKNTMTSELIFQVVAPLMAKTLKEQLLDQEFIAHGGAELEKSLSSEDKVIAACSESFLSGKSFEYRESFTLVCGKSESGGSYEIAASFNQVTARLIMPTP